MTRLGDFNGDGVDDFAVGAFGFGEHGNFYQLQAGTGFDLQPGIVVLLENGAGQGIANWSDIVVFRALDPNRNNAAGLNIAPCATFVTCTDFLSDPLPEDTDPGFAALADSGFKDKTGNGKLTIGDLAAMNPTFIQEANDGTVGGLSFTNYTAGANTYRIFSDVETVPQPNPFDTPPDGRLPEPNFGPLCGIFVAGLAFAARRGKVQVLRGGAAMPGAAIGGCAR
jgi:hypothetical protein